MRLAVVAFLALAFAEVEGQRVVASQVPDAVSCARCRITFTTVATIGTSSGPGSLDGILGGVAVDGRGRYWVFSPKKPPLVFDSTGAFLRQIGRAGQGPGEFLGAGDLAILAGDSVAVFDYRASRVSVVTPDLKVVATIPMMVQPRRVAGVGPRRVVVSGYINAPDRAGWPLHLVDLDPGGLKVTRSFGPEKSETRRNADGQSALGWRISPASGGAFWTEDLNRYRALKWSRDGRLLIDLERNPEWFAPQRALMIGAPTRPPNPRGLGVSEGAPGLLWTFTAIPDRDWAKAWIGSVPANAMEVSGKAIDIPSLFDAMVEVLDLGTHRVVAQVRVPDYILGALPGGRAVVYAADRDGFPRVEIKKFVLHR